MSDKGPVNNLEIVSKEEAKEATEIQNQWAELLRQEVIETTILDNTKQQRRLFFARNKCPRRVYVGIKIKRISDIDNIRETFRCRFHIYMDTLLSLEDYKSYLLFEAQRKKQVNKAHKHDITTSNGSDSNNNDNNKQDNKKDTNNNNNNNNNNNIDDVKHFKQWIPSFRPQYEFLNAVEVHCLEEVPFSDGSLYKVEMLRDFDETSVGFDPNRAYFSRCKMEADITFAEELELQNFPVDCQDFTIVMRASRGRETATFAPELRTTDISGIKRPSDFVRVDPTYSVLDEWEFHNSRIEFVFSEQENSRSTTQYHMLKMRFKMRRRYAVYFWNLIIYMFAIASLSMTAFALSSPESRGDRLNLAITLLLTAVAFQYLVSSQLPHVPYLTLLHKYVIVSFLFICCVAIESALLSVTYVSWFSDPWFDKTCCILFGTAFAGYNIAFWILSAWKRHDESRKLYLDSDQLAELVETQKKQFQIQWNNDPTSKDILWCGNYGRIAAFVDGDATLTPEESEIMLMRTETFGLWLLAHLRRIFCFCCWKRSRTSNTNNNEDEEDEVDADVKAANNEL